MINYVMDMTYRFADSERMYFLPRTDSGVSILPVIQEEYVLEEVFDWDDPEYELTEFDNEELLEWYEAYCEDVDERDYVHSKSYYQDECEEM